MKKVLSILLVFVMLVGVMNVGVLAADIETPTVTASNAVSGGINVYWNAVDGAIKYNVYRRNAGSSSWIPVGTTNGKTNIIDSDVEGGKFYAYSVRAYEEAGSYSAYNSTKTYTVKCVEVPKLTNVVNTTNGLLVKWNAVAGANNYRVYRRGAGSTSWLYLGTTTSTTFTDSKATSGAYWRYTVRAVGSGYYSGFDTNGLYTIRLANPYSIKASTITDGIKVNWAKINGATGYRVYRRGAGQTYWTYLNTVTGTTFKDTNVSIGQFYRYTVRAARGSVLSDFYTEGAVVQFAVPISKHLPIDNFLLSSGAGGWGTSLTINKDLTFSGRFYDSELGSTGPNYPEGTIYECKFSGKFSNPKQLSQYHYSVKLSKLIKEKPDGTEWIEENRRFIASHAYGIQDCDTFYLYTPGTPVSSLPPSAISWSYTLRSDDSIKYLDCYCFYNTETEVAFFSI